MNPTNTKENAATIVTTYELFIYGEDICNSLCKYLLKLSHISLGCELHILQVFPIIIRTCILHMMLRQINR